MVCVRRGISGLRRGGRTFGELGLQGQPDGSSVRNILEDSCTEEETVVGKAVFNRGYKFAAPEARNNFYSTSSRLHR